MADDMEDGMTKDCRKVPTGRYGPLNFLLYSFFDEKLKKYIMSDTQKYNLLCQAAMKGHISMIYKLLAMGADINFQREDGWTVLMSAAHTGQENAVRVLLAMGANINLENKRDMTALMCAAETAHLGVIQELCVAGANANYCSKDGWTALRYASMNNSTEVINYLKAAKDLSSAMASVKEQNPISVPPDLPENQENNF